MILALICAAIVFALPPYRPRPSRPLIEAETDYDVAELERRLESGEDL